MKRIFLLLMMVAGFSVVTGCGDQSQKKTADFKTGVDAMAQGNYAAALENFLPIAESGHVEAQQNIALIYAKGLGVPQDWVQADKWFSIAAASGKETAINNKKVIEVHMPPEKIAEANALAQEWLAKHKK